MEAHEKPQFVQVILTLAATFRTESSEPMYEGYWIGLNDLTLATVQEAAAHALQTCRFMPSVSELRELAGARLPTPRERATKAWSVVVGCMGRFDYYDSVNFDDPVVHATIRAMGGWMRFWERLESEGRNWLAKEFERTYAHLMATGFPKSEGAYLPGYHEQQNGRLTEHSPLKSIATGLPVARLSWSPDSSKPRAIPVEVAEAVVQIGSIARGD